MLQKFNDAQLKKLLPGSALRKSLLKGHLESEILFRVTGCDFDPKTLANYPDLAPEGKLRAALMAWVETQSPGIARLKALYLPLLLGEKNRVPKGLTEEGLNLVCRGDKELVEELTGLPALAAAYEIDPAHMVAGRSMSQELPEMLPIEGFHNFIPDLIQGAEQEGSLTPDTKTRLLEMYEKIKTNQKVDLMSDAPEKDYLRFCSYLAQIATAYGIGKGGGDIKDKAKKLDQIAEAQKWCFPRWISEVQQIYFFRPRKEEGERLNRLPCENDS